MQVIFTTCFTVMCFFWSPTAAKFYSTWYTSQTKKSIVVCIFVFVKGQASHKDETKLRLYSASRITALSCYHAVTNQDSNFKLDQTFSSKVCPMGKTKKGFQYGIEFALNTLWQKRNDIVLTLVHSSEGY